MADRWMLTKEIESVKVQLEAQQQVAKRIDAAMVAMQERAAQRDAEVKSYAKELDNLARDSEEMRVLLDMAIPVDALRGLRSNRSD